MFPNARVIQCDVDHDAFTDSRPKLGVVADSARFAAALLQALESSDVRLEGFRTAETRARIGAWRPRFDDRSRPGAVDPRPLSILLDRLIPEQRTIVQDGGHFSGWGPTLMSVPDERGFDWGQSFMAVGLGIGAAIGAAIGRPDRRTVLIAGDGGTLMSLGDLESVRRLDAPLLVIIYNDAAYGAEVGILEALGMPTDHAYFAETDFEAVGKALGFSARTVTSLADVEACAAEIADGGCSLLLDCRVDPDVRGDWFVDAFGRDSWLSRLSG
jgi:thiamine pyrophosphate-dependent acetolactate synthase large subunit-like protein